MISGNILIVGSGQMAQDYAKVLKALNVNFTVIGRGKTSAEAFEKATGVKPVTGGIEIFVTTNDVRNFSKAIIATGTEALSEVTLLLAKWGLPAIMVEKPGAKSIEEVLFLGHQLDQYNSNVVIAYNRRFYSSVQRLKELIEEDGGVSSFNFEFTEWGHVIAPLQKAEGVKENWLFANSTHVIDLAFFLGGEPRQMASYTAEQLGWHPVAIFAGAGITCDGALFSYQANWKAPGRWGVEILTTKRRFYLRPLEKLQVQQLGSVQVEFLPIDDKLDQEFKPGLYQQTLTFLNGENDKLVGLSEHIRNCNYYKQILTSGISS
ncbi:Gfo/Idh/MocA family oxidoreductase [Chitinophaga polysaccharea]|uniref:Gfo/Idh/MocA family oxidoreductase n=1 Tax=Chitinophaga polysaccharea TaxID=1293035 RepID=UPI0024955109|nr:Gfo/Idh/MocA family oxidoreductase [Chitinophaga polysaccharea]